MPKTALELLNEAEKDGFVFLLQSATELVFFKNGVPDLSPDGFFRGCTIYSKTAREILEKALGDNTTIRRNEQHNNDNND